MSFASIVQRLFGIEPYIAPQMTQHHDDDLGDFTFCPTSASWVLQKPFHNSSIRVRGRSTSPTSDQKQLLEMFTPLLESLTAEAARMLRAPQESPTHAVPSRLLLRELRFEATGKVELFFDPEIEINSCHLWPMATCSREGKLLSTDWTT